VHGWRPPPVTMACPSRTGTATPTVVVAGASVPPTPVDAVHVMSHSIVNVAANFPPAIDEACWYSYEHGGGFAGNSSAERTTTPGPTQVTVLASGSPGVNTRRPGVAVAVTVRPGICACALTGAHWAEGTANSVGIRTSVNGFTVRWRKSGEKVAFGLGSRRVT